MSNFTVIATVFSRPMIYYKSEGRLMLTVGNGTGQVFHSEQAAEEAIADTMGSVAEWAKPGSLWGERSSYIILPCDRDGVVLARVRKQR